MLGKKLIDFSKGSVEEKKGQMSGTQTADISKGQLLEELVFFSPKQRHSGGVLGSQPWAEDPI